MIVYLAHDGAYWEALLSRTFPETARRVGLRVVGKDAFDAEASSYEALADKVALSGAQGVVLGASAVYGGDRVLKALRTRLGPRVTVMASNGFVPISDALQGAGRAAGGLTRRPRGCRPNRPGLTPAARRVARELGPAANDRFALEAAQATEVVLAAIARSDGTRASVLRELQATRVSDGILGTFRFDRNGDITPAMLPVLRVTGTTPPGVEMPADYRGAVVERLVRVSASR